MTRASGARLQEKDVSPSAQWKSEAKRMSAKKEDCHYNATKAVVESEKKGARNVITVFKRNKLSPRRHPRHSSPRSRSSLIFT